MADTVFMDALWIEAQPPTSGYSPTVTLTPRPPLKPAEQFIMDGWIRKLIANGMNVFPAADAFNTLAAMDAVFVGLNGLTTDEVKAQLTMHAAIQKNLLQMRAAGSGQPSAVAVTPNERTEVLYAQATWGHDITVVDHSSSPDFFGTPLMFVAGVYYWLFGGGQRRYVNIGSLNLQMVTQDIPPIRDAVASNGPGTYNINSPFSYNTFGPAYLTSFVGLLLGRVSGNVNGVLTIAPDGAYTFSGSYTLNPDVFDADPSNRPPAQEAATTALRYLGDVFGHTDYTTEVLGAQPLNLSGTK